MLCRPAFLHALPLLAAVSGLALACSADPDDDGGAGTTTGTTTGAATGSTGGTDSIGGGLGSGTGSNLPPAGIERTLPTGFTPNSQLAQDWECGSLPGGVCFTPAGGYRFVGSIADFNEGATNACANVLRGIVRDFEVAHVDFGGDPDGADAVNAGLVASIIGGDRKPAPSNANFLVASALGEWFENGAGGNVPYVVDFWLEPQGDSGLFVFDSSRFFPIDNVGVPSGADNDGAQRNFLFTTEIHTAFEYQGGEVFTFSGDDDVFVFINGALAVDIGGVHSRVGATVDIDTFAAANGMTLGEVYNLDLFHAERNPTGSNFRIETSLDFKECALLETDLVIR